MIDQKYWLHSKDQIKALSKDELIEYSNAWANYWRYDIGINVLPAAWRIVDKEKRFIPIIPWKEHQDKPIPEKLHKEWLESGAFVTGIAGIFGHVWHRPDKKGYYFGQVDADNLLAIQEIIKWKGDPDIPTFAKRMLVEQHADNQERSMHIDVYSKFPLTNKDPDVPKDDKLRPSFEVHCIGRMGIMACSKHKKGHPMMLLDSGAATEPLTLEDDHFEEYLNSICIKYGLELYLRNGNTNNHNHDNDNDSNRPHNEHVDGAVLSDGLVEMIKSGYGNYDEAIEIIKGTRHNTLVKVADSILFRYSDDHDLTKLRDWFILINEHCCKPDPLPEHERNQIWSNAVEYVGKQKAIKSKPVLTVSKAIRERPGASKTVRGTIFSISTIFKVAMKLCFKCLNCRTINQGYHIINEGDTKLTIYFGSEHNLPRKCVNCGEKDFSLDYELSKFNDAKIVVLQNVDLTSDLDETLEVMLLGEHTEDVKAGEVVIIGGSLFYGSSNLGRQSKNRKTITLMTAKFVTYEGRQDTSIKDNDIESFRKFATINGDDVIKRLVSMTAPNVIGEEPYKLGVLRSIVGGSGGQRRGRIHTLSVGDKGLAKSMVMNEGLKMKPNARRITAQSASSTSALGIVDSANDVKTLVYGPIPLSSGSMVGIDELQSWTFDNQGVLLNVMEEGKFNLLKYARDKEIVAETTILATANPQDINYEGRNSISIQEINILAPLRDRFDQIYVSLDEIDEERDWEYAERRLDYTRVRRPHNYNFIKKYLIYATGIEPILTPEASEILRRFWIELRKQKLAGKRTFESIFRIAEATAKLRLKTLIDVQIAQEVQESIIVMQTRLGKYVKLMQDINDLAVACVKEVIENVQGIISFEEAMRQVCKEQERVNAWVLGGKSKVLKVENNIRFREIRDRFLQDIKKPGSKILITRTSPLLVVWQTTKTSDHNGAATDITDATDKVEDFENKKSIADNGNSIKESPKQDVDIFTPKVENISVSSVASVSHKPEYEYLPETDSYRCKWCRCIYHANTKDTNAAHPCNFTGRPAGAA